MINFKYTASSNKNNEMYNTEKKRWEKKEEESNTTKTKTLHLLWNWSKEGWFNLLVVQQ